MTSTERNETIPSASERVAEFLARVRTETAGDQGAVAEALTVLGLPTKASTVARIESGKQSANVEQLLLMALFNDGIGLRAILQTPFRVAEVVIETDDDRDCLLGMHETDPDIDYLLHHKSGRRGWLPEATPEQYQQLLNPVPGGVFARSWRRAARTIDDTLINRRYRQIADELGVDVPEVKRATRELYRAGIYSVINERTAQRLSQDDPRPPAGSATWQAYRSHAVRAVTREIAEHLGGVR